MGKNLLVLSVWVSVLMLASCVGSKKETVTYTPEEIADAGQVMKYYDASLALLKNVVKERDVNAVLYGTKDGSTHVFIHHVSRHFEKRFCGGDATG